jgi:beta-xylosidase
VIQLIHYARVILLIILGLSYLDISSAYAADISAGKSTTQPGSYLNPIGDPPIHLQDPFILVQAKKYYLFGASPNEGIQCYESPDLVHWNLHGWAWRKTGIRVARGDFRAPQVFSYQGMFCMVYSAWMPAGTRLALAASTTPEGPYHDLHVPWLSLEDGCTAGDVFIDNNGKAYLIFSQRSTRDGCKYSLIYGVSLSQDLSKMIGEPVKLLVANQRWELAHRDAAQCNEWPRMFRLGSKYYLTYSANDSMSSDVGVGYAVADKPLAVWTKSGENPLLSTHSSIGVVGPGHASVFRSVDRTEWFIVYDSFADPNNPSEDHVVNIDRLMLQDNRKLAVSGPTRSPQPLVSGAK